MCELKVLINEMTRKEIADRLDDVKTVIVPVASTEQHGPHLPLQHDTAQVCLIAEEAASRLYPKVLVTPPVAVGVSAHHLRWPMSLTLQPETFVSVIVDICRSLKHHGIARVLILNGHGGNRAEKLYSSDLYEERWEAGPPIEEAAKRARGLGLKATATSWWDLIPPKRAAEIIKGGSPGHAGEFETSFGLFMYPGKVKLDLWRAAVKPVEGISPDTGDATMEKGKLLFEETVRNLVSFLEDFVEEKVDDVYYRPYKEG
ncbi:MAG: creatininase family protein [Candidatus Bathyarchaeota archaeon]|nr:creatininase family protein [Candidatus Bathyarchaeota archaeon]MDH5687474.1 creatininase family protein [Candidatus Bathyarchaeota archaeon]